MMNRTLKEFVYGELALENRQLVHKKPSIKDLAWTLITLTSMIPPERS